MRNLATSLIAFALLKVPAALAQQLPTATQKQAAPGPWAPRADAGFITVLARPFTDAGPLSDWGYGLGFSVGVGWGKLPVTVGGDFLAMSWGSVSTSLSLRLGDQTIPAILTRHDQTLLFDLWLRVQPALGQFQPYFEGIFGIKALDTSYSLAFSGGSGQTGVFSDQSTASTSGLGAGLAFAVAHSKDGLSDLLVSLGLRRLAGSRTTIPRTVAAGSTVIEIPTDTTLILLSLQAHAPL